MFELVLPLFSQVPNEVWKLPNVLVQETELSVLQNNKTKGQILYIIPRSKGVDQIVIALCFTASHYSMDSTYSSDNKASSTRKKHGIRTVYHH